MNLESSQSIKPISSKLLNKKFIQIARKNRQTEHKFNPAFHQLSEKYAEKSLRIINNKNKHQLFRKIVKKVEERAQSFYHFGFKSYEKKQQNGIFEDVFQIVQIPKQKLCGSMSIAELWSNRQTINFLKQNNMFMNKARIMEELKKIKSVIKAKKNKQKMGLSNFAITQNSISFSQANTSKHLSLVSTKTCQIDKQSTQKQKLPTVHYNIQVNQIKRKLKNLKKSHLKSWENILKLERDQSRLQSIEKKYDNQLILYY